MSDQNRRFTSNNSFNTNHQGPPENLNSSSSSLPQSQNIQNNTQNKPQTTSTLPQVPPNYQAQDLTIYIGPDGRKKLVNSLGQQSMIYPFANKYFGDYMRNDKDSVGIHNRRASIQKLKQGYHQTYKVNLNSKIYNYDTREIHLLSQYYQNLIDQKEKSQIIQQYQSLKSDYFQTKLIVLGYTIFYFATRRMNWVRLTRQKTFPLIFYTFGGMFWFKKQINLAAFEVTSVMEHNTTYQRMLNTYENDYKIVY